MVILRYFRFICVSGVVISAISFVCGTLAIATGSWLLSQGEVQPNHLPPQVGAVPQDPGGTAAAPRNLTDLGNFTGGEDPTTTTTTTSAGPTTGTELTETTRWATVRTWGPSGPGAGGNNSNAETQHNVIITTSGLWHICQADIQNGVVTSDWLCWNVIQNLAEMNTKQLMYFQSMLAFELISVAATLAGCCVATVAIYKQQPLAVLVAAFTMFFAGMFMLVGHLMMLSIHKSNNDDATGTTENGWYYGWSFTIAWLSFCLCLVSGIINCVVYRNFRKMSEELTGTPSRVKYANRPPPVSLGSSI